MQNKICWNGSFQQIVPIKYEWATLHSLRSKVTGSISALFWTCILEKSSAGGYPGTWVQTLSPRPSKQPLRSGGNLPQRPRRPIHFKDTDGPIVAAWRKTILFCLGQTTEQRCSRNLLFHIQTGGSIQKGLHLRATLSQKCRRVYSVVQWGAAPSDAELQDAAGIWKCLQRCFIGKWCLNSCPV